MGLATIHGFLHEAQTMSAVWGVVTVRETLLIEMDSPLEDVIEVQDALPAYDFGVTTEPTFTIGLSYHPDRTDLILKDASGVREHPDAGRPFWYVELTYETGQWMDKYLPGEDAGKGSPGRVKRFKTNAGTGTASLPDETIIYPWDEPVTWSAHSKAVKSTIFKDSTGVTLQHANRLPIIDGIDIDLYLETHQFTWNVRYSTFTYSTDIAPYIGKINNATCFGLPAKAVFLEACSVVENYRTVTLPVPSGQSATGAKETHHYVTINATFILDRRGTTEGYFREANRRVSMHTQEFIAFGLDQGTFPIHVSDRGDLAKEPWPLVSAASAAGLGVVFGMAYPYKKMSIADPDVDYHWIDPLYPLLGDLTGFVATHSLVIP